MTARTPDLGLAAALLTIGYVMIGMESGESELQKVFCFDMENADLQALFISYKDGRLTVDAYHHAQSLKELKRRLYHPDRPTAV